MAIALMQILHRPFHLALIDAAPGLGGGVAHGQARSGGLLNARARDLSVLPGVPGDFAVWTAEKLYGVAPGPEEAQAAGDRFAPRASFGDCIRQRYARAALLRRDVNHERIDRMAVRLAPEGDGFRPGFETGPDCRADWCSWRPAMAQRPAAGVWGPRPLPRCRPIRAVSFWWAVA